MFRVSYLTVFRALPSPLKSKGNGWQYLIILISPVDMQCTQCNLYSLIQGIIVIPDLFYMDWPGARVTNAIGTVYRKVFVGIRAQSI